MGILGALASLFSAPGMSQVGDATSLAGVIDLHAHVAPETAALNYKRSVDAIVAVLHCPQIRHEGTGVQGTHDGNRLRGPILVSQMVPGIELFLPEASSSTARWAA